MAEMKPPAVIDKPIRVLTEEQLRALLGTCSAKTFIDRRDNAIIRLFVDTGIRRAEMAGLGVDDIDIREPVAQVFGRADGRGRCHWVSVQHRHSVATSESTAVTHLRRRRTSGLERKASGH